MQTKDQIEIDIDAETLSQREKLIIRRLGEYRTVEADIRRQQRIISGELTNCLPTITIQPADEDHKHVIQDLEAEGWGVDLDERSEGIRVMAEVVKRHIDLKGARYANRLRVVHRLKDVVSDDAEEDQAIRDAYVFLTERGEEESVKLTTAERYASDREAEVKRARDELERLSHFRKFVMYTLEDVKEASVEWWTILYYKYVMQEYWWKVCERASREGVPLTPDEYRLSRKKAIQAFSDWVVGLC